MNQERTCKLFVTQAGKPNADPEVLPIDQLRSRLASLTPPTPGLAICVEFDEGRWLNFKFTVTDYYGYQPTAVWVLYSHEVPQVEGMHWAAHEGELAFQVLQDYAELAECRVRPTSSYNVALVCQPAECKAPATPTFVPCTPLPYSCDPLQYQCNLIRMSTRLVKGWEVLHGGFDSPERPYALNQVHLVNTRSGLNFKVLLPKARGYQREFQHNPTDIHQDQWWITGHSLLNPDRIIHEWGKSREDILQKLMTMSEFDEFLTLRAMERLAGKVRRNEVVGQWER